VGEGCPETLSNLGQELYDDEVTRPLAVRLLGDQIGIRPLRKDDLPVVWEWNRDQTIRALMGETFGSPAEVAAWWQAIGGDTGRRAFAILLNGALIGEAGLQHVNWRTLEAEVRICIGYAHLWNRGYGTAAMARVLAHAYRHLGLRLVYLRVLADNGRAIRSYEKLGFRKRARLEPTGHLRGGSPVWLMELSREQFLSGTPDAAYGQSVSDWRAACVWTAEE
jgi:RimJ/RimL family protein N-acetyltransferase